MKKINVMWIAILLIGLTSPVWAQATCSKCGATPPCQTVYDNPVNTNPDAFVRLGLSAPPSNIRSNEVDPGNPESAPGAYFHHGQCQDTYYAYVRTVGYYWDSQFQTRLPTPRPRLDCEPSNPPGYLDAGRMAPKTVDDFLIEVNLRDRFSYTLEKNRFLFFTARIAKLTLNDPLNALHDVFPSMASGMDNGNLSGGGGRTIQMIMQLFGVPMYITLDWTTEAHPWKKIIDAGGFKTIVNGADVGWMGARKPELKRTVAKHMVSYHYFASLRPPPIRATPSPLTAGSLAPTEPGGPDKPVKPQEVQVYLNNGTIMGNLQIENGKPGPKTFVGDFGEDNQVFFRGTKLIRVGEPQTAGALAGPVNAVLDPIPISNPNNLPPSEGYSRPLSVHVNSN